MRTKDLSPREGEIVNLCVEGLTNEAIAQQLGLSVGTINTYWLRIRMKVGGSGRTDTVAIVIKDQAEKALREANVERSGLASLLISKERDLFEARGVLALLNLAMDQLKSVVWATDTELRIQILANGQFPSSHFGVLWETGKTIQQIFKTEDPANVAVRAHLEALHGKESQQRLGGEFRSFNLRVLPLRDESDETKVVGCVSILHTMGEGSTP